MIIKLKFTEIMLNVDKFFLLEKIFLLNKWIDISCDFSNNNPYKYYYLKINVFT